jgi:hypothetical protein
MANEIEFYFDPQVYLYDFFKNMRSQVIKHRDRLNLTIDNYFNQIINNIDNFEQECLKIEFKHNQFKFLQTIKLRIIEEKNLEDLVGIRLNASVDDTILKANISNENSDIKVHPNLCLICEKEFRNGVPKSKRLHACDGCYVSFYLQLLQFYLKVK